jgi:hypothetical protein
VGALILALSPWLFFGGLSAADLASGEYARAHGAHEGNAIIGGSRARSIAVKAGETAIEAYFDRRLSKKGRWIVRGAVGALRAAVVVHNLRQHR